MAAKTGTYTLIASATFGGSSAETTFSSIPQTYTDLVLVVNAGASAGDMYIQFSGDTGNNYSHTWVEGRASGAVSSRFTNRSAFNLMYEGFTTGSINVVGIFNVMDYANTTTYKTAIWREGSVATSVEGHAGLWRSTGAVTSLRLSAGGNFVAGSTAKLYGIEAGNL